MRSRCGIVAAENEFQRLTGFERRTCTIKCQEVGHAKRSRAQASRQTSSGLPRFETPETVQDNFKSAVPRATSVEFSSSQSELSVAARCPSTEMQAIMVNDS